MKSSKSLIGSGVTVCGSTALFLLLAASPLQAPVDSATTPISCKPVPPVEVSLQHVGGDSWRLYVTSTLPSRRVKVWLWSQTATGSAGKKLIWEGQLGKDEGQSLNAVFRPETSAARVWACIETVGSLNFARNFTTFELSNKAIVDPGTLKTDPSTGEKVWEYTSSFGGGN